MCSEEYMHYAKEVRKWHKIVTTREFGDKPGLIDEDVLVEFIREAGFTYKKK